MTKKKFIKVIFWNIMSLLLFSGLAFASTVPVSIPDTSCTPGDAVKIPILVGTILPSDTVRSAQMTLTFNPAIIQAESIKVIYTGTLTENWLPFDFASDSNISIALAGVDSITGSGTLVYLRFKVRSSALPRDSSVIHFSEMMFNEGAPAVSLKDGVLRITPTSVHENENLNLPKDFNLGQNFPNPFNPSTTVPFRVRSLELGVGRPIYTTLIIYNLLGQKVNTLLNESLKPGTYQATWDGKNDAGEKVPSGVYFYRLTSGGLSETRKMVLMR